MSREVSLQELAFDSEYLNYFFLAKMSDTLWKSAGDKYLFRGLSDIFESIQLESSFGGHM